MEHGNNALYNEWQQSVREYASIVRIVRTRGMSLEELDRLTWAYLHRLDSAYARFKESKRQDAELCLATPK